MLRRVQRAAARAMRRHVDVGRDGEVRDRRRDSVIRRAIVRLRRRQLDGCERRRLPPAARPAAPRLRRPVGSLHVLARDPRRRDRFRRCRAATTPELGRRASRDGVSHSARRPRARRRALARCRGTLPAAPLPGTGSHARRRTVGEHGRSARRRRPSLLLRRGWTRGCRPPRPRRPSSPCRSRSRRSPRPAGSRHRATSASG